MSLSLVKRSTNGSPVTAAQNDANMTAIENAVNTNTSNISATVTQTALNGYFEGIALGKQQVDWARVINKPTATTSRSPFRALPLSNQTISASGSISPIVMASVNFNVGGVWDGANSRFVAPVTGYYQFILSVQVQLTSGSPTGISIIVNLRQNGSNLDQATLDNSGTGTRIYKITAIYNLSAGDFVDASADFTFSGTATWTIPNVNTTLSGFLIQ